MIRVRGVGHGKVLLCGEHAVVYGHPAIALAVDRCTQVTLEPTHEPTEVYSSHEDGRLAHALAPVLPAHGLRVTIDTDLPVGRGMGSSAALAVATVRALAALDGRELDADAAYSAAMPIERTFHGNPSGVDVAVSSAGGCLWFRRGDPPERLPLVAGPWRLVVLDSGQTGNTQQLVNQVATQHMPSVLQAIGALVASARDQLHDPVLLGSLLTENHRLLQQLGVSTPDLDALVALAMRAGAHGAKLSGAGGGGIVIALVDEVESLLGAAQAAGVPAFGCAPWQP